MKKIILLILLQFTTLMAITFDVTNDGQIILKTDTPIIEEPLPIQDPSPIQDLVVPQLGTGTTYYVDAISGRDTNDGLSTNSAWQSISKVSSSVFMPGDNILFKKGHTFFGKLSLSEDGIDEDKITIGAYGTGARPILTMVQNVAITWSNQGGNLWKSNITHNTAPVRIKKDGREVLKKLTKDTLGTKYSWYASGGYLYHYSLTNPSTSTFSYADASYGAYISGDHIILRDIEFIGGTNGLQLSHASNTWLHNLKIGDMSYRGLYWSWGDSQIQNPIIDQCDFDGEFVFDTTDSPDSMPHGSYEGIYLTRGSLNGEMRHNTFKNWSHASFNLNATNSSTKIEGMKIYGNDLSSPDMPYGGRINIEGYVANVEIYNNYIHDNRSPIQIVAESVHFHHNIIKNIFTSPTEGAVGRGLSLSNYTGQAIFSGIYENNIIINAEDGAFYFNGAYTNGAGTSGLIIRNNIIKDCGSNSGYQVWFRNMTYGGFHDNILENNTFYGTAKFKISDHLYNFPDVSALLTHNNSYSNNIDQNPLFIYNTDFHLQASSPAIGTGVKPTSTLDYVGDTIIAPYNMGIYK